MHCTTCSGYQPHIPLRSQSNSLWRLRDSVRIACVVQIVALVVTGVALTGLALLIAKISFSILLTAGAGVVNCCQRHSPNSKNFMILGFTGTAVGLVAKAVLAFSPFSPLVLIKVFIVGIICAKIAERFFDRLLDGPMAIGNDTDTFLTASIKANSVWRVKLALFFFSVFPEEAVRFKSNLRSPLQIASFFGRVEIAKILLDKGVNPEGHPISTTPLFIAIRKGYIAMVDLLIERGAKCANEIKQLSSLDKAIARYYAIVSQLVAAKQRQLINEGREKSEVDALSFRFKIPSSQNPLAENEVYSGEAETRRNIVYLLLAHNPSENFRDLGYE